MTGEADIWRALREVGAVSGCSLDEQYGCGQRDVGVVTLALNNGTIRQETPCLSHLNEMCRWIEDEGRIVGLVTWRAEVIHIDLARLQA